MSKYLFSVSLFEKIIFERDQVRSHIRMLEDDMSEHSMLEHKHCIDLMVSLLRKESALTAELARFTRKEV